MLARAYLPHAPPKCKGCACFDSSKYSSGRQCPLHRFDSGGIAHREQIAALRRGNGGVSYVPPVTKLPSWAWPWPAPAGWRQRESGYVPPESPPKPPSLFPRSPSAWHDLIWKRPPSHSVMQRELADFLRSAARTISLRGSEAFRHEVHVEHPIPGQDGYPVAFLDVVEFVAVNLTTIVHLFEVKPVIEATGPLRQIKGYLALAEKPRVFEWEIGLPLRPDQIHGHIVVPFNDPRLAELRAEWPHVWAWGETFEKVEIEP